MDVFSDYFTSVDFSDEKRIKVLLDEYFTSYKSSLNSQGSYYMENAADELLRNFQLQTAINLHKIISLLKRF